MKKILFLLLCTVSIYGQTYQNPTFGTITSKTAPAVTSVNLLANISTTGTIGKIDPVNLPYSYSLNTIADLTTYAGSAKFISVLEAERGGDFYYVASGLTVDNGVVFPATVGGYWVRQLNGFVVPEFWGTGTTTSHSFIQSALDYAAGKNLKVKMLPKQYNIDDILIIKSNTELELDKATIIRLNDNVNKSMLRNFGAVYAGSTALIDSNITVSGGTWEGNGANQTLYSAEPSLNVGLEFHNIENIRLRDTKINLTRSYATYFSSVKNVYIDRVNIDNGDIKDLNRDGLHFNGPADNVLINDCILRGTDDQLAFNANDIDYAYKVNAGGDITNTIVNNVIFDNTYKGIRLLSAANNITRMTISNLSGTTSGNIIECGNYELGTGGRIDDVIINNINFNVNQTVNDGRVLFHFRKGGYGKIIMDNVKVGGNHYVNPTFEFLNGVDMDYFKISNLTSFGTDTGAYADFKIRQGEATFPTIDTFIIDGYNFTSPLKTGSLIDFNNLTSNNLQFINCTIGATTTLATVSNGIIGKFTLENNTNDSSTNGIQLTNTSIQEMQITGDYFKNASGFAFSQDTASNIVSLKGSAYISNNNADVSSNSFINYQNNGVTKTLQTVATATLQQVLTNGNTSTLGMSVKQVELGTGASDTVPTLSWNYSGAFGWGMFEKVSDGNFKIAKKVSGVAADAFEIARSNGNIGIGGAPNSDKLNVVGNASGSVAASSSNHFMRKGEFDTADSANVKLSGNQTILAGVKTINNSLAVPTRFTFATQSNATDYSLTAISNSTTYPGIFAGAGSSGSKGIEVNTVSGGDAVYLKSNMTGSGGTASSLLLIDNIATGNDITPIRIKKEGVEVAKIDYLGNGSFNNVTLNSVLKLKAYTVGTLPAGAVGDMAYVTDALAPAYNVTVVGGGAIRVPVFYNGTNWTAH